MGKKIGRHIWTAPNGIPNSLAWFYVVHYVKYTRLGSKMKKQSAVVVSYGLPYATLNHNKSSNGWKNNEQSKW